MECKIYERLRQLRLARGITQVELAEICGVDHVDICRWELNMHIPSLSNIVTMADYFDVDLDYFVGRRD